MIGPEEKGPPGVKWSIGTCDAQEYARQGMYADWRGREMGTRIVLSTIWPVQVFIPAFLGDRRFHYPIIAGWIEWSIAGWKPCKTMERTTFV